MTIADLARTDL